MLGFYTRKGRVQPLDIRPGSFCLLQSKMHVHNQLFSSHALYDYVYEGIVDLSSMFYLPWSLLVVDIV